MTDSNALALLTDRPGLDALAEPLSRAVRDVYASAGDAGRQLKNAAHGVWLGHPLHPVFTDIPLGAWTTALALDVASVARRDRGLGRAADWAVAIGLAGAVGAAVTGLTDWSETDGQSRRTGLMHGLMNITATGFFAISYALRKSGSREAGRTCSAAGLGIAAAAAYLGGHLVYDRRVGVTHADAELPEQFVAAAESAALSDAAMIRGKADETDVLLARQHGRVCALVHSCAHMGGPLSEGTLKDGSVVCPWHGSEFALADGRVVNGPATQPQPCLVVRERGGAIEVKAPDA
jgi:nitrite reductase/ring-hydroxylating ferredoxin subunit